MDRDKIKEQVEREEKRIQQSEDTRRKAEVIRVSDTDKPPRRRDDDGQA